MQATQAPPALEMQKEIEKLLESVGEITNANKIFENFKNAPPLSRYIFTYSILPEKNVIQTRSAYQEYGETPISMVIDLFLGMLAERQDTWGLLLNYPRTAFIDHLMYKVKRDPQIVVAIEEKEKFTALYPGDLDQIIVHGKEYTGLGLGFTYCYFVKIIKIRDVDRDAKKVFGTALSLVYSGDYSNIKKYTNDDKIYNKIENNVLEIVFGPGWTFTDELQYATLQTESKNIKELKQLFYSVGNSLVFNTNETKRLLANLENVSRNWTVPFIKKGIVTEENIRNNILKSFTLGMIPVIVPTGDLSTIQINAAHKIGEVTKERLDFIFNPAAFEEEDPKTNKPKWMGVRSGPLVDQKNNTPKLMLSSYNPHYPIGYFDSSHVTNKNHFE